MSVRTIWFFACLVTLCGPGTEVSSEEDTLPEGVIRWEGRSSSNPHSETIKETQLPTEAEAIISRYQASTKEIERKTQEAISVRREVTIQALQKLQDQYTRDAMLDEAVAIRDQIRTLQFAHLKLRQNPGNLTRFSNQIGRAFYFEVVGTRVGSVWGTNSYTHDSNLACAAVHAGVLKPGQRGIVKVTIIESPDQHLGSTQHGVTTFDFGPFAASYTIERAVATDVDTSDADTLDVPQEPEIRIRGEGRLFLNPGF